MEHGGGGGYSSISTSGSTTTWRGYNGTTNGGTGGGTSAGSSDGAGNPAGNYGTTRVKAKNGTGGLLIICGDSVINNRNITAIGSIGGYQNSTYGGASGGGSINIFYHDNLVKGTIDATGGTGGTSSAGGGAGGAGTVSCGSIATGTYVEYSE